MRLAALVLCGGAALAAAAAAAAGEPAPELSIGIREYLSDVPAHIADLDGYYAREGARVRTVFSRLGREVAPELLGGRLDLAILGNHQGLEALTRAAPDDPVVVVACLGGGGRRWRVMASEASGVRALEGLDGRRLGVWPSSYGYRLLARVLAERRIVPIIVKLPMEPEGAAAALERRDVDAVLAWEPIPALLEDRREAREIFSLDGLGEGVPVYLLARREVARRRRAEVVAVLRALERASAFVREHPDRAAERVAARERLPARVLARALRNEDFSVGLTCRQRASLREALRALSAAGVDALPASGAIIFDDAPLRELRRGASGPAVEERCAD